MGPPCGLGPVCPTFGSEVRYCWRTWRREVKLVQSDLIVHEDEHCSGIDKVV
jgi:hypothetical protein